MGDELPPPWMWPVEHELVDWFEQVEDKRRNRFQSNDDDDDASSGLDLKNELSRDRR